MKTVVKNRLAYLILSVIMLLVGVCIVAKPDISADLFCIIIGIAMLIIGAIMIIRYIKAEEKPFSLQILLAVGVVIAVLGIIMLFRPEWILGLLHALIGFGLLIDGIFKIIKAFEAKKGGKERWWVVLLLAVITCVLALILIFDPFSGLKIMMTVAGVMLIIEGIQNIWVALYAVPKE